MTCRNSSAAVSAKFSWRALGYCTLLATASFLTPSLGLRPASAAATAGGIETITVTAERREERAIDVGASVTAVSGGQLDRQHVVQLRDLINQVPNADIKNSVPGIYPVVTIRGVGVDDYSITVSPSAGIYVDEVPLVSLEQMSFDLYDTQRVEVVKGPQGTLYGLNSTAGAINYISNKPGDAFEALARVGFGNYDALTAQGMVNIPITDDLKVRFAGQMIQQFQGYWSDGILADGTPGHRTLGDRHDWMGRISVDYTPMPDWDVLVKYEAMSGHGTQGQPNGGANGAYFGANGQVGGGTLPPRTGLWTGTDPLNTGSKNLTGTVTGKIGGFDVKYIGSYQWLRRAFAFDGDGTPFEAYNLLFQNDRIDEWTQEVHVERTIGPADVLLGAFFLGADISKEGVTDFTDIDNILLQDPHFHLTCPPFCPVTPPALQDEPIRQMEHSQGAFANVTWHLSDEVDLITGIRYSWDNKNVFAATVWNPSNPILKTACTTPTHDASTPCQAIPIDSSAPAYRAQVNWKPVDNALIYASFAQSSKSGGLFANATTSDTQYTPFLPERLRAYEVGGKYQGSDFSINSDVFFYDHKNFQAQMRVPGVSGATDGNVPEATEYGFELEATWIPVDGLTLALGYGYLHTRLTDFGIIGVPGAGFPAGNRAPNAPAQSVSGSATYEFPLFSDYLGSLGFNAQYKSDYFKEATNALVEHVEGYVEWGLTAGIYDEDHVWELQAYCRNCGNETHPEAFIDARSAGIFDTFYNEPRTFGATLTRHFD